MSIPPIVTGLSSRQRCCGSRRSRQGVAKETGAAVSCGARKICELTSAIARDAARLNHRRSVVHSEDVRYLKVIGIVVNDYVGLLA